MKRFNEYLQERVLSIGLNPKHDHLRQQHEDEIYDAIRKSYADIGGYGGKPSGSKEESEAIRADIRNPDHIIKATRRNGRVNSATIYKRQHGRKMIAIGADGTPQGKMDVRKSLDDDNKMRRSWGEVSKAAKRAMERTGFPKHTSQIARDILKKDDIEIVNDTEYSRKIGGNRMTKTIMGHIKRDK